MTIIMSMVESISSMTMDTPIATILVSFSSSSVVKLTIEVMGVVNEFDSVSCV